MSLHSKTQSTRLQATRPDSRSFVQIASWAVLSTHAVSGQRVACDRRFCTSDGALPAGKPLARDEPEYLCLARPAHARRQDRSAAAVPETVSSNRAEMRQLYRSPNGDSWFLARDPATGFAFIRHQANAPSGGQVTDIELGAFLSGPGGPEHEALLRLIGASILNPRGAEADDEPLAVNTGREWSDEELNELGNMLVRGLSIEEI